MKILVLGSANFDFVYGVNHISREGETLSAYNLELKHGGKGLNQAIALARAGADTSLSGCIGPDGNALIETLQQAGVNTEYLEKVRERSGHAIIQLTDSGANSIVIYGGANEKVSQEMIDKVLGHFEQNNFLLLQNEISNVPYAIRKAKERGIGVAFNPSPISEALLTYPLDMVDLFILNEIEGQILSGLPEGKNCADVMAALVQKFPDASIVLTMGSDGVMYHDSDCDLLQSAYDVPVVDTTGAGDTFCGYFLACRMNGLTAECSLETASKASALAIGKKGAAGSIPTLADVTRTEISLK